MTTKKVRKQIYIEARQNESMKETGETEAELIRQAIDRHTGSFLTQRDMHAWEEERAFIDHLIKAGPVLGGRTWTCDDLHR